MTLRIANPAAPTAVIFSLIRSSAEDAATRGMHVFNAAFLTSSTIFIGAYNGI